MKKKVCLITAAVLALATIAFARMQSTKDDANLLLLTSVEALAQDGETSNTGPAEEKKCVGGAHRMVCRCINTRNCTGTDCY